MSDAIMKDRLLALIKSESLSPSQFADEIGIQRSAVSHILSGRNMPSYDVLVKILKRFPRINSEWLLLGQGSMYKTIQQSSLFDQPAPFNEPAVSSAQNSAETEQTNVRSIKPHEMISENIAKPGQPVKEILLLFADNTYQRFVPEN